MEMEKWPEYSKYAVLADNSNGKIRETYEAFLSFKKVMDVLHSISYTDKTTYSYNNNIYNKKITSEDARKIILNVSNCRWTDTTAKLKLIASQLELKM
tara:strand:+ start:245 stop:538 length:294 start_codon:yes stop_codon:yes gene_type:complete